MRTYRGLDQFPRDAPPSVVAQGTFDGIHLGHQAVIRRAVERARDLRAVALALTFDPHPVAVLRPADAPPEILALDERLERIDALGVNAAVIIPFTREFSRIEADAFVREILVDRLRAREVVVGFNHTFGRGARGTAAFLEGTADAQGIGVHVIPPLTVDGVVVSSSSVRAALRSGDVERAASLLGRAYAIRGPVQHGAHRGHGLGFPTANLLPGTPWLLATGVYAGRAEWEGGTAAAVVNVGVRPTFAESVLTVEAHLLDVSVELYGQHLTVAFLARIRDEARFPSAEELRRRIAEDIRATRALLGDRHA